MPPEHHQGNRRDGTARVLKPHMSIAAYRMFVRGGEVEEVVDYFLEQGFSKQEAWRLAQSQHERYRQGQRALANAAVENKRDAPRWRRIHTMISGGLLILGGLSGQFVLKGTNSPLALILAGVGVLAWGLLQQPELPRNSNANDDFEDEEYEDEEQESEEDEDEEEIDDEDFDEEDFDRE